MGAGVSALRCHVEIVPEHALAVVGNDIAVNVGRDLTGVEEYLDHFPEGLPAERLPLTGLVRYPIGLEAARCRDEEEEHGLGEVTPHRVRQVILNRPGARLVDGLAR